MSVSILTAKTSPVSSSPSEIDTAWLRAWLFSPDRPSSTATEPLVVSAISSSVSAPTMFSLLSAKSDAENSASAA